MAGDLRQPAGPPSPVRVRRPELIRPADDRRAFTTREAQRRLEQKERPHWALIAYAVFLIAVLLIFSIAYATYAFSRYRGEILPGVHVDQLSLSGLTENQAKNLLDGAALTVYNNPVRLVHGTQAWSPRAEYIGYKIFTKATVKEAEKVGRQESFLEQLIDRLPIHPDHSVPLVYAIDDNILRGYIQHWMVHPLTNPAVSANLQIKQNRVLLMPSKPGTLLDIGRTVQGVHDALGALTTQTVRIQVNHVLPAITDADAIRVRNRVENFLTNPPVMAVGRRVITTSRADFAPMLRFQPRIGKQRADIVMIVNPDAVRSYVARLASTIDRPAQNAQLDYEAGKVIVLSPRKTGRTLDQTDAFQKLLGVITNLKAHARLRLKVQVTQPPIDLSSPASLGIDTVLGVGETSFQGAPPGRRSDITDIASRLNKVLLQPGQEISFNTLVGPDWSSKVYVEEERNVNDRLVPGRGGALQQVATTFFRALFASGLQLEERHAHVHRFGWYEPPVGLDAVVSPADNDDLRFRNNTGKYLFVKTRIEPVRRELWIYIYGPKLGWKVSVDPLGKIIKQYAHGPDIIKQDPTLNPGDVRHTAWAHNGADTLDERTIEYPNGSVRTERVYSHYQPWRAVILEGSTKATPTPTPEASTSTKATPTPTASSTPQPTPTATYDH